MATEVSQPSTTSKQIEYVSGVTVRLAGDSGDGMQLAGTQLTNTSALIGNDIATFPTSQRRSERREELEPAFLAFRFSLLRTKFSLPAIRSIPWLR